MGFYGKIANSNKTAFSFDITYQTRQYMDEMAQSDGVFIGRYVLIEYDEPPITGYFNGTDFYTTPTFNSAVIETRIEPREGVVYQDLMKYNSVASFYRWDGERYVALDVSTGYAACFNTDVIRYGRGYDSTAWMKTWDTTNQRYRYVMVAELNTIVPTFSIIADQPGDAPTAPYFDRDSSNVNYFLHVQSAWQSSIRQANPQGRLGDNDRIIPSKDAFDVSDENVSFTKINWSSDVNLNQQFYAIEEYNTPGDIFYNKAGFQKEQRNFYTLAIDPDRPSDPTDGKMINTINYDLNRSGRRYGAGLNASGTAWTSGKTADDMMQWYIHLPILGNSICTLWDTLYGYDTQTNSRYTRLGSQRSDPNSKVSYNTASALGCINRIRDMLGWGIQQLDQQTTIGTTTLNSADVDKLYYTLTSEGLEKEEEIVDKYYYYAYHPLWVEVFYDSVNDEWYYNTEEEGRVVIETSDHHPDYYRLYYLDPEDHIYKHVQGTLYQSQLTDGTPMPPYYQHYYTPQPQWILTELETPDEDSLYGLILQLHQLIGTNAETERNPESLWGVINIMNDTIKNIGKQLAPQRILATDQGGQIITTNTEFPFAATRTTVTDKNNVTHNVTGGHESLTSQGEWRLLPDYKLYTYSEMNDQNGLAYFDAGYYGNSNKHIVEQTDTLGEAIRKISNELADLNYQPQTAKLFVHARVEGEANSDYLAVENGRNITDITLDYELNKGPRYSISIQDITGTPRTIYSATISDTLAHLANGYAGTAIGTQHDTDGIESTISNRDHDITYRISVVDERSNTATANAVIKYMNKCYWGVGSAYNASALDNVTHLDNAITGGSKLTREKFNPPTMTAGENQYVYWMQPASFDDPIFRMNCVEGGMDYLGIVEFTNASNYATNYKVWRSTNTKLGKVDLVVL